MSERERLFCSTLDDLEQRLRANDDYQVLRISALLRKLLLDAHPLVDQINERHRLKLEFSIAVSPENFETIAPNVIWSAQDGLDPDTAPPFMRRLTVPRDRFLGTVVSSVYGKCQTVKDVILFEANVMGGVHAGSAREEKERVLAQLNTLSVGGYRASLRQLLGIGRVVARALEPLRRLACK